jgi:hypothetical protein
MAHNQDSNQMNISYELLMLLQWMLEHEQEPLRKIINRALHNGLQKQLESVTTQRERQQAAAELQDSIIDFFMLLETQIDDLMNEDHTQEVIQRNMLPALKQVDARTYSYGALETSIAKAEAAFCKSDVGNPKDILCKELLKRWKPSKKLATH